MPAAARWYAMDAPMAPPPTTATSGISGPSRDTCRPLAGDHAAPASTLALAKVASVGRGRVRPLAWCSRPRSSTASLDGPLPRSQRHEQPAVLVVGGKDVRDDGLGHPGTGPELQLLAELSDSPLERGRDGRAVGEAEGVGHVA